MRHVEAVIKMLDPTQLAGDLREAPPAQPMVQARHGLPSRRGRAQEGHRAVDGEGDSGVGVGRRQYKDSPQGRVGGSYGERSGVSAESQLRECSAQTRGAPLVGGFARLKRKNPAG
jgi:hypothetical protein